MAEDEQWRRFEREARAHPRGKFWAIRAVGAGCELRYGIVGADQIHAEALTCASPAQACAQLKQRIRTKLGAGWIEVEASAPTTGVSAEFELELRQSLAGELGDLEAWSVYADLLSQRNVVVGERLALGLALASSLDRRGRRRVQGRIQQLESAHARELFGPTLAGILGERRFEGMIGLERRLGMIVGARLRDVEALDWPFEAVLASLLGLDAAQVLVDLAIVAGARVAPFEAAIELLSSAPRPTLRRLELDLRQAESSLRWVRSREQADLRPMAELGAVTPGLERVDLVGPFVLADWYHAHVRELVVRRVAVVRELDVGGCDLPALERLQLADPVGVSGWSTAAFPALRHLLLNVPGQGVNTLAALLRSPILAQLQTLVVIETQLGDAGVSFILRHATQFDGLERLMILDARPRRGLADRLRARLPRCVVGRASGPRGIRSARILAEYDFDDLDRWVPDEAEFMG